MINESNEQLLEGEEEEEDGDNDSDLPLESNETVNSHSTTFIKSSSNHSIVELCQEDKVNDCVQDLKAELHRHCQLNWLEKFEPSKHNPKVELNLMLEVTKSPASMERSVENLFEVSENKRNQSNGFLLQNDDCIVQRALENLIKQQREQRIIYTEILFRPEMFHFQPKVSHDNLQRAIEILIHSIRVSIKSQQTKDSFISYVTQTLPFHMKIILSEISFKSFFDMYKIHHSGCRWNNVEWLPEFIQLARHYPDDIVGIDIYGSEEECRNHWQRFLPYRKLSEQNHLAWQTNIDDCNDELLLLNMIEGLNIQRLLETNEIFQSKKSIENILIKHGIHLIVCPTSPSYKLIDLFQSEHINYSISSLSSTRSQQNLVSIYQNLLDANRHTFTCEHMQWLNENALKSSFASQKLKKIMMIYLRENYLNCHQQTLLLEQFQESTKKWEQEMGHIIDKNVRTAMDLAIKMRKENLLPPKPGEQRFNPESIANEGEEEEEEEGEEEEEEEEEIEE